jgi:hypothetical protein
MSNDFNSPNPYQSSFPAPAAAPIGEQAKPTSMVVFGILNLVFGAFGILMLGLVVLGLFLDLPKDPDNPMQQVMENPTYKTLTMGLQVFSVVLTAILIASGVGLINGQLYGRRLAIIYAIGTMILVLIGSAITIVYVALPVFAAANELPEGPERIGVYVGGSFLFLQPVCGMIYPLLLLIFMKRAPIKNYFNIQ